MVVKKHSGFTLKTAIDLVLSGSGFNFSIKNLSYLPRWIILSLDIIMVIVSGFSGHFLLKGIGLNLALNQNTTVLLTLYLGVTTFFFWVFRTYSGIIRHSSFIDALKLFMAQSSAFLFLLFVNTSFEVFTGSKLFLNTHLFISIVLSFMLLLLYRIVVKQMFEHYIDASKQKGITKALIYGADANAISVANALRFETPFRYKVIGFVDRENRNTSKRILDLPILHHERRIPVLLKSQGAQALIIADRSLSKDEKLAIVDECLDYNFKVLSVPDLTDWVDQGDISKKIKNFQIQDLLERSPIQLDNKAISSQLKGKTIMITGAAGSIGSEIVWQVCAFQPSRVILVDQAESPLHHLSLELGKQNFDVHIECAIADIRDFAMMHSLFSKSIPDVVYHAAAYKHVPLMEENPSQAVFTNILGTKNLADLAVTYGVESFVMVSTDKAVNPSNVMGASKRIAEKYVQSLFFSLSEKHGNHTKFITTRFGNVLGSNGSVVPLFTQQIANGGPITITHPEIIRYFMTIPEACQLVLEAGAMGMGGEIFIFDMGKPVKIIDLANKMIRLAGLRPEKDVKIDIVGLRPGEKLYEELLNDSSKTLPTHHEKIMIAKEVTDDYEIVNNQIMELLAISKALDSGPIVAKMKSILPEYKSMNSEYELLDVAKS